MSKPVYYFEDDVERWPTGKNYTSSCRDLNTLSKEYTKATIKLIEERVVAKITVGENIE